MERPTSPHLSIYKPQITSITSILHRITGLVLYVGALAVVCWLMLAAYAPSHYAKWYGYANSWAGRMVLLGVLLAFHYHLANGIRHLFWDIGKGYAIRTATRSGWCVVLFTFAATAAVWCYIAHYFSS